MEAMNDVCKASEQRRELAGRCQTKQQHHLFSDLDNRCNAHDNLQDDSDMDDGTSSASQTTTNYLFRLYCRHSC